MEFITEDKAELEKGLPVSLVTLTNLFSQDLPDGTILFEFPSTSNKGLRFVNDEKFLVYDFPPPTAFKNEYLLPLRACPVAGNKLPLILSGYPSTSLKDHWNKWVPGYEEPVIKPISEIQECGRIVTSFQHQKIPSSKHAVDPQVHYWLLSKRCIPHMGANHPQYMTTDNYTLPCMVKAAHGTGTKGTFKVETKQEMERVLEKMDNNLKNCQAPVITEVIEGITGNNCLQFYLYKSGEIHWLGVTNQIIGDNFIWGGGVVNWGDQTRLKSLLYDKVVPVKEYLHKQGYFGIVGIDILTTEDNSYIIDVNPRINGSTPQLLLAPVMATLGYDTSVYLAGGRFNCKADTLLQTANLINSQHSAMVIVLSLADVEKGCEAHVVAFGKTEKIAWDAANGLRPDLNEQNEETLKYHGEVQP
ncbi:uncharacterized protein LOC116302732 [Actinia tenebrosa]|uniref:Uncharacterized protein LOC116302732 n=1 Tax=Actinia tenebrosa TaxID=6105 RepID=A0A6P8IN38_ACTTE|nr:uncharacterized protein LOC116302732 [Actinia tenebrosa]